MSLRLYLSAHPHHDQERIAALGFSGIRFDVSTPEDLRVIPLVSTQLTPLCIVNTSAMAILTASAIHKVKRGAIELVNEPNLNGWTPREWAAFSVVAYECIKDTDSRIKVVSGGISNLNRPQLDYLGRAIDAGLKFDILGFHRYQTEHPPTTALPDHATREAEMRALRNLTNKPLWCTEIGWHTFPQRRKAGPFGLFSRRVQWTDEDVARFAREEISIQQASGVEVMNWYQLTDGPDNEFEDRFGILRTDGSLKPVARAFAPSTEGV